MVESRAGRTHRDALRALMYKDDAAYVEGLVVVADRVAVRVLEHEWLEVFGAVLDPAPQFQGGPISTYFRTFAWTGDEFGAHAAAHQGLTLPLAIYRPDGGRRELAWRDAALAAQQYSLALRLTQNRAADVAALRPLGFTGRNR